MLSSSESFAMEAGGCCHSKNCVSGASFGPAFTAFLVFLKPYPRGRSDSPDQPAFTKIWVSSLQSPVLQDLSCVSIMLLVWVVTVRGFLSDSNTNITN